MRRGTSSLLCVGLDCAIDALRQNEVQMAMVGGREFERSGTVDTFFSPHLAVSRWGRRRPLTLTQKTLIIFGVCKNRVIRGNDQCDPRSRRRHATGDGCLYDSAFFFPTYRSAIRARIVPHLTSNKDSSIAVDLYSRPPRCRLSLTQMQSPSST